MEVIASLHHSGLSSNRYVDSQSRQGAMLLQEGVWFLRSAKSNLTAHIPLEHTHFAKSCSEGDIVDLHESEESHKDESKRMQQTKANAKVIAVNTHECLRADEKELKLPICLDRRTKAGSSTPSAFKSDALRHLRCGRNSAPRSRGSGRTVVRILSLLCQTALGICLFGRGLVNLGIPRTASFQTAPRLLPQPTMDALTNKADFDEPIPRLEFLRLTWPLQIKGQDQGMGLLR